MSKSVKILERVNAFTGFFNVDRLRLKFLQFNGDWSPEIERDLVVSADSVAVLLFDPKTDQLVLVEQFRFSMMEQGLHPWTLEVVAGMIEPGETPEAVARREVVEESGLVIHELIEVEDYWVSIGNNTARATIFCGRVDAAHDGHIFGCPEEAEDIRVHVLTSEQALTMLDDKAFTNAPTIISMQWFAANHQALRERWLTD